MDDDSSQIEPPPSFVALYTDAGGRRLTQPPEAIRERYELCEDLAHMLCEQASTAQFKSGASERQVLATMQQGLTGAGADSPVREPEAAWVVTRIAEILGWPALAPQA